MKAELRDKHSRIPVDIEFIEPEQPMTEHGRKISGNCPTTFKLVIDSLITHNITFNGPARLALDDGTYRRLSEIRCTAPNVYEGVAENLAGP